MEAHVNHRGINYRVWPASTPGVWIWDFQIGDQVMTGKTETNLDLLAIRRVQSRIDRELKKAASE
jgi:hypothetical protein